MNHHSVAVFYGGQSTEHEISIITALQVMSALSEAGHTVHPVYISKAGVWYLGNSAFLNPQSYTNLNSLASTGTQVFLGTVGEKQGLCTTNRFGQIKLATQFDVAFPIFHGKYGEDGTIQGLLKLKNIPVAGCTLLASSVGIDKFVSKRIAQSLSISTVPDLLITKSQWLDSSQNTVKSVNSNLGNKVIIKPSMLGSSIGISTCTSQNELHEKLEVAFTMDSRVLVEKLLDNPTEVQISIMGNDPYELSVTEQPLKSQDLLSYEDKYVKGQGKQQPVKGMASAQRLVPAPIPDKQTRLIEEYATTFYRSIGGQGLARVDFLINKDTVYFNEINTIPGSLAFYLWEKTNKPFPQLVDELVQLALKAHEQESSLVRTFETNVLANIGQTLGSKT